MMGPCAALALTIHARVNLVGEVSFVQQLNAARNYNAITKI